MKPPEPPGPPPAHSTGSSFAKTQPPMPPQQKRERHGWLMKTKDLVVAYKNRDWHRFDELSKEQLADIYIYIYCRTQFEKHMYVFV